MLLSQILIVICPAVCRWGRYRLALAKYRKRLRQLTRDEKSILKGYIDRQTRTEYFDCSNGIVAGLEVAGILYRPSLTPISWTKYAYNINDVAWEYLNKHRSILAGLQGQVGREEK